MLSKTLKLNLSYLKIIHILHPHYHKKNNRTHSKIWAKGLHSWDYTINHNENEDKNRKIDHIDKT